MAQAFLARAKALGLDARIDAEGNVIGIRKGMGNGPKLLVSAHLDTVFPEGTDVTVKIRDGKWYAPGVSDDSRGLTVLLSWLKVLNDHQVQTVGDIVFAANLVEEELGDLRGMKAIFREHGDIDGMLGLKPDPSGSITTGGVGSHRYEVTFKGPGGHSYVTFGLPSAIHAMCRFPFNLSLLIFQLAPMSLSMCHWALAAFNSLSRPLHHAPLPRAA